MPKALTLVRQVRSINSPPVTGIRLPLPPEPFDWPVTPVFVDAVTGVFVGTAFGAFVGVLVGVCVAVGVLAGVFVGVFVGVFIGVLVGVLVGVLDVML